MTELNPVEWAVRPLKHYADFRGRAPRAEYWWFYLLTIVANTPARVLDNALGKHGVVSALVSLAFALPWLAVSVRRLHDSNRGGWWLILFMAVLATDAFFLIAASSFASVGNAFGPAGSIMSGVVMLALVAVYLFFMVTPGTEGSNDYGPDPYGPDDLEQVFA